MKELPDHELDRLLKEAYAPVEVSSDFTLRLWRRLIGRPAEVVPAGAWKAASWAAAAGILLAVWTWTSVPGIATAGSAPGYRVVRTDLYGNAPHDTLAGSMIVFLGEG